MNVFQVALDDRYAPLLRGILEIVPITIDMEMKAMRHGRQNRTAIALVRCKTPRLRAEGPYRIVGKIYRCSIRPHARHQMMKCHRSQIGTHLAIGMKGNGTGCPPIAQRSPEAVTAPRVRHHMVFINVETRMQFGNRRKRGFNRDGKAEGIINTA